MTYREPTAIQLATIAAALGPKAKHFVDGRTEPDRHSLAAAVDTSMRSGDIPFGRAQACRRMLGFAPTKDVGFGNG